MTAGSARRLPLLATLLTVAAVLTMVLLGVWQLQRKAEKEAVLAQLVRNLMLTQEVQYPAFGPVDPALFYRRSRLTCLETSGLDIRGGRNADDASVFQLLTWCRTGAEGPGVLVSLGTTDDFNNPPHWPGGQVAGFIVPSPQQPGLIARTVAAVRGQSLPRAAMLLASPPVAGLDAHAAPSPDQISNNHLAYAVQWFLFALAAAVIYGLALRRRWREGEDTPTP